MESPRPETRLLEPDAVESFEIDGVVLLPGEIDADWVERLRAAIERGIANPGPFFHGYESHGGRFHGNLHLWENDETFADYCLRGPLPRLAAELLVSDRVDLFYDQLFVKEPGTENPTGWHNDQPYWPVRGHAILSFWLALDRVTAANGALEFILGSHRGNRWFRPEAFAPGGADYEQNPRFEKIPDFETERDRHAIRSFDLEPGDVIAFHGLTVHGAPGNLTQDVRRRGYTVRYCGSDMRYTTEPGANPDLRNASLANGAWLDSDQYPRVWTDHGQGDRSEA
jgi:ectoine hydroxylase-related dioxygenase (phytanoyl-CoA dioxygenase family)